MAKDYCYVTPLRTSTLQARLRTLIVGVAKIWGQYTVVTGKRRLINYIIIVLALPVMNH